VAEITLKITQWCHEVERMSYFSGVYRAPFQLYMTATDLEQ